MALNFNNIKIDEEFEKLLPPLLKENYNILEQSLLTNGFDQKFGRIKVWFGGDGDINNKSVGYIIDGHNRYRICQKHKIKLDNWDYEAVFMDSKEEVIKWMYENQLARRNLSEVDRYEIVERYSDFLEKMAKENQSKGGKGLSNLTKINVRKEKAEQVGISEGSYHKLGKVMKSDNEEIKQKLREKKISVDKAYKEIQKPKQEEKLATPMQKIEKVDSRMDEIEREICSLQTEKQALIRKRTTLFEALDIECELKYEFCEADILFSRDCRFFIEVDGHKQVFVECGVFTDEEPFSLYISKVPDKYKNDFKMLYRKAHFEEVEYYNRKFSEFESRKSVSMDLKVDKEFYKKCFRVLAKSFHPDNGEENIEDMQLLNQLKQTWGV